MKSGDHSFIVNELNEHIELAGVRPSHWLDVVQAFRRHFPETKVTLQAIDRRSKQPVPFIFDGWSDKLIKDYEAYFRTINPWRAAWLNMGFMSAEWSDDYLRNSELRKSEFYVDMLRPEGECDSGTGIKLIDENDRLAIFMTNYASRRSEDLHSRVSTVMRDIAAPLYRAIDTNRLLGRAAMAELAEEHLLQALCEAALVVDHRGRIIGANPMAQDMLADGSLIRTDLEGRLSLQDSLKNEALPNAVSSICNDVPGTHIARDFSTMRRGEAFRLTFLPVSPGQMGKGSDRILPIFMPARAALVIIRPEAKPDREGILQKNFGFTRTQVSIALALTEGGALVDVAERLGMKYETARSHLKAIFNKVGVNKQSELVGFLYRLDDEGKD